MKNETFAVWAHGPNCWQFRSPEGKDSGIYTTRRAAVRAYRAAVARGEGK